MFTFLKTGYQKVKQALGKTRSFLGGRIQSLLGRPWDESTLEELEQILYEADLGTHCVEEMLSYLKSTLRFSSQVDIEQILDNLKQKSLDILQSPPKITPTPQTTPRVYLIVGINGSGKTTTIAKLALHYKQQGKKVLVGAGDTFRAGAIHQLGVWAERLGVDIVRASQGADPSSVAFDAVQAAVTRDIDIVLLDTAGRLQNKEGLMQELEKTKRSCAKVLPGSPQETLLILDATTGQNAIDQAHTFHKYVPLTALILTKLDGSAKGGIILSIYKELGIPIRFIGVGEQAEDLIPFDSKTYVEALFAKN
ncbi:MAG: signal recognition particle-docking protein FtsY [Chlamydiae bacterium]|nr:signal recognition particle-docking protein FtsY [Chlamydiota bacterium]